MKLNSLLKVSGVKTLYLIGLKYYTQEDLFREKALINRNVSSVEALSENLVEVVLSLKR